MNLTPEQKSAVASWVHAGDNLSAIQRRLADEFQISLTYRDVRFLVDDLDLALKDAAPKADLRDVTKAGPAAGGAQTSPPAAGAPAGTDAEAADLEDEPVGGTGTVTVSVDKVTLIPGALASGGVTFSDGVTGKWIVDQYGRPGFTEMSKPDYRPNPADAQEFMQELSMQLQKRGF